MGLITQNAYSKGSWIVNSWLPEIMAYSDIPNSIQSTEDIEIAYFSGGVIEVKDQDTNKLLSTHVLSDKFAPCQPVQLA